MQKLTEADKKFIAKFFGNKEVDAPKDRMVNNRFSGQAFKVTPLVASIISFIFHLESAMNSGRSNALTLVHPELKPTNAVMNFDRARYLVMKLDSEAYMGVLD